jgi:hypothetical protein
LLFWPLRSCVRSLACSPTAGAHIGGDSVRLAVFALGFLLTRAVGSPMVDRYGGARVAACSIAVEAAGLLVLALATVQPLALVGAALAGPVWH